MVPPITKREL
jgi:hypothetical protein